MNQKNELMSEAEVFTIIYEEFGENSPNLDVDTVIPHASNGVVGC